MKRVLILAIALAACSSDEQVSEHLARGKALLAERKYEAAAAELSKATALDRNSMEAWLNLGPDSWLYRGWQPALGYIPMEHEQRIGMGVVTTVLFLAGLWWQRRRPAVLAMGLFVAALFFLSTQWGPAFRPWRALAGRGPRKASATLRGLGR